MKKALISLVALVAFYAASWAINVGIIYLLALCFSLDFSLPVATGVWLVLCLIKLHFPTKRNK